MDIGKFRAKIQKFFSGDLEIAMSELYLAVGNIGLELLATPGYASISCSVAIAPGQAVNINNDQLRLADASLGRPAIGICVNGAGVGAKARIIIGSGYAAKCSGLTLNSSVYLGNAGALVFTKPGSGMVQGLGFTLSATEMFVTISQP